MSIGKQLQMLIGIVVGYSTITLPTGQEYGMYAMPFDSVSDAEGGLTMYEVFPEPLNPTFHVRLDGELFSRRNAA